MFSEKDLTSRGSESEEMIEKRLNKAEEEISRNQEFDRCNFK